VSRRLNQAVAEALPHIVARFGVLHITGPTGHSDAFRYRNGLPPEVRERYQPVPFLGDEMGDAYAAVELVIGRAGSSTLAEATAHGLPLVVIPYPHAGAHQA